jgi:hypothetical protein
MSKNKTKNVSVVESVNVNSNNANKPVKAEVKPIVKTPAELLLESTQTAYKELDVMFTSIENLYKKAIVLANSKNNLVKDTRATRFLHLLGKCSGTKVETAKQFDRLISTLQKDLKKAERAEETKAKTAEKIKALTAKIAELS